jgi:hypothetical protein
MLQVARKLRGYGNRALMVLSMQQTPSGHGNSAGFPRSVFLGKGHDLLKWQ